MLSRSVVSDSATPWTVACQAPLSMGLLQARVLEWVAMPSSRSSQPRDRTLSLLHLPQWQAGSLPLAPPGKSHWPVQRQCTHAHADTPLGRGGQGIPQRPGTMLTAHFTGDIPRRKVHPCSCFTDKYTEAQRGVVTSLRPHREWGGRLGSEFKQPGSRADALKP